MPETSLIKKHPGGRPTKYIPEKIFPIIEEYIGSCGKEQMELPTIEGLSLKIGVIPETIIEWGKKYPEFSESIKKMLARQKTQLMNDGMYGGKEVNQAMAIFLLKVNHGMKDGSENLTQQNIQINVHPAFLEKYGSIQSPSGATGSNKE